MAARYVIGYGSLVWSVLYVEGVEWVSSNGSVGMLWALHIAVEHSRCGLSCTWKVVECYVCVHFKGGLCIECG